MAKPSAASTHLTHDSTKETIKQVTDSIHNASDFLIVRVCWCREMQADQQGRKKGSTLNKMSALRRGPRGGANSCVALSGFYPAKSERRRNWLGDVDVLGGGGIAMDNCLIIGRMDQLYPLSVRAPPLKRV